MKETKANSVSIRLPSDLLSELKDEQYARRKASGVEPTYAELLSEAWQVLRGTITESTPGTGGNSRSGDILPRNKGGDKWHGLLDIVLNSRHQRAIQENLTSFSDGIKFEAALADLQQRVDAGEFSREFSRGLPNLAPPEDRDARIEAAQRKAAEGQSLKKAADRTAAELRGTGAVHPGNPMRYRPPKTGSSTKT